MQLEICGVLYTLKTNGSTNSNLLSALIQIKRINNRSLAFRSGCKSGVCGSCAVVVNGEERLACKTIVEDKDIISPLNNHRVLKDLIVDIDNQDLSLNNSKAYLESKSDHSVSRQNEKNIDIESNCILCNSCVSSCPVYSVNSNFIAPFALMRNYRYINDVKENIITSKLEAVQRDGIWDCTLCGNCNMVCPSHIDIKGDIEKLRNKSAQFGYNNPNINIGFDTSLNFGFNPNGF